MKRGVYNAEGDTEWVGMNEGETAGKTLWHFHRKPITPATIMFFMVSCFKALLLQIRI